MIAVFGLVLFVACANVAQLRLAQGEARRKELGVRIALGGGGWRVARQLLLETALLSLAGAGLGLLLAQLLMEKVTQFASTMRPLHRLRYPAGLPRAGIFGRCAAPCRPGCRRLARAPRGAAQHFRRVEAELRA